MGLSLSRVIAILVRVAFATAVGALLTAPPPAYGQSLAEREYQIKAAFLYNFLKFIDWPSEALPETSETITVCVISDDPVPAEALESIKGKTVKGKRLAIRQVADIRVVVDCHVLFVPASGARNLAQVMPGAQQTSLLTVGEMDRFLQTGGIINFVTERNKIRFEINLDNAQRARLKLASQLISLGKVVRQ